MGILIPLAKISQEEYVKRVNAIKAEALKLGRKLIDATELVVRQLGPRDLGLSTDEWTFNVAAGENTIVNTKLDNQTLVVIFEIFNLSTNPQVNEAKFGTVAKTIEDVYFENIYMYDTPAGLLDEPVVFQPGSQVVIKAVAKASNTAEKLGFVGFVVEPAGKNIASNK